ncbi:MAG TPA: hypothetical protein VGL93_34020 [Streptosporangiaceae bacterium]|jgi:hypothetical protein
MAGGTARWPDARSDYEAADATGFRLTPEELRRWRPFYPIEIAWARRHGLPLAAAHRWAADGVRVHDAVRARALGMTPADVRRWTGAGFLPADAVEAAEAGIPLERAVAWREVGFVLPDAALLIRDGWTLEAATAAR